MQKIEFSLIDNSYLEVKYDGEEALEDKLNSKLKNEIIRRLLLDIARSYKNQGKSQIEYCDKLNKYMRKSIAAISDEVFNKAE